MQAEIVVQDDADGDDRVGRDVAVGLGFLDHDARRLVLEATDVIPDLVPIAEALGVEQAEPEREAPLDGDRGFESGPRRVKGQLAAGRLLTDAELCLRQGFARLGLELQPAFPPGLGAASGRGPSVWIGTPV